MTDRPTDPLGFEQQEFAMRYGAALSGSMMRICTIVEAR